MTHANLAMPANYFVVAKASEPISLDYDAITALWESFVKEGYALAAGDGEGFQCFKTFQGYPDSDGFYPMFMSVFLSGNGVAVVVLDGLYYFKPPKAQRIIDSMVAPVFEHVIGQIKLLTGKKVHFAVTESKRRILGKMLIEYTK